MTTFSRKSAPHAASVVEAMRAEFGPTVRVTHINEAGYVMGKPWLYQCACGQAAVAKIGLAWRCVGCTYRENEQ